MTYVANVTPVDDLVAMGLPPAQAAALHVVAGVALNCVAANCNLLVAHGATPDEVAAYREPVLDKMAGWIKQHVPQVAEAFAGGDIG